VDGGLGSAFAGNVTTSVRICAHEQVEAPFDDVLKVLPALGTLVGADSAAGDREADFVHRNLARLPVRIAGHEASLLLFRLVGGRQHPITEIALAGTVEQESELQVKAGRQYVEDVARALEAELRAEAAAHDASSACEPCRMDVRAP
jgi:hypothetical protein